MFDINTASLITDENAQQEFAKVANILLNQCLIFANNELYRICEIEFYLDSDKHKDRATHNSTVQYGFEKWYVHRSKKESDKKDDFALGIQRFGIDLCLGCGVIAFGILIKNIKKIGDDKANRLGQMWTLIELLGADCGYIPSDKKSEEKLKAKERYIEKSKKIEEQNATSENDILYIKRYENIENKEIKAKPRIGINCSKKYNFYID